MKCSVCAKEVPAEAYAEHLSTEHGVTDDPGAVLLQHLADAGWEAHGDEPTEREVAVPAPEPDVTDTPTKRDMAVTLDDEDDDDWAIPPEDDEDTAFPPGDDEVAIPPTGRDVTVPPAPPPPEKGRGRGALVAGLLAALVLIGAGVAFAVTRDGGSKHVATRRASVTTALVTIPTILAGPPQTQVPATTVVSEPVTATPPVATPATPPPAPGPDPGSQLSFLYADASPCTNGQFDVRGSITNHNSATYTIEFTITVFAPDSLPVGSASVTAPHIGPGQSLSFDPTGSCAAPIAPRAPATHHTSITPG